MARMISENEKRDRRNAVKQAKQIQILEARGFKREDSAEVINAIASARSFTRVLILAEVCALRLDPKEKAETEQRALSEIKKAAEIVRRYDPARAAILDKTIAAYQPHF